jgi:hypothetical protein
VGYYSPIDVVTATMVVDAKDGLKFTMQLKSISGLAKYFDPKLVLNCFIALI